MSTPRGSSWPTKPLNSLWQRWARLLPAAGLRLGLDSSQSGKQAANFPLALGLGIRGLGVSSGEAMLPRAGMQHAHHRLLGGLVWGSLFLSESQLPLSVAGHDDLEGLCELICILEPRRGICTLRSVTAEPCAL